MPRAGCREQTDDDTGSFRKLGVPYFGVLIIRILLFRALYLGPLFSEIPISGCGRGFAVSACLIHAPDSGIRQQLLFCPFPLLPDASPSARFKPRSFQSEGKSLHGSGVGFGFSVVSAGLGIRM